MYGACTATIGASFGVKSSLSLRSRRSTTFPLRNRRVFPRVSIHSNAVGRFIRAVEVFDAPTHCVVESGGDESNTYYQYSFGDESPGGLARPDFESDGVKLYISKSAPADKRGEYDAPVAAEVPATEHELKTKVNETKPMVDVRARVVGAVTAAKRVIDTAARVAGDVAAVEKVKPAVEATAEVAPVVEQATSVDQAKRADIPPSQPTVFPVNSASTMRHCVYQENTGATTYCFTEDAPTNAVKPAFETAGIKAYARRGAAAAVVETVNAPEPSPAPQITPITVPETRAAEPPKARNVVSSPGPGVGGDASGKSGAAVFERGVGIAAWQGLEIGYEVNVVLEFPVTKSEARAEAPFAPVAAAPTASPAPEKKIWFAEPVTSAPRAGRQTRSGAAIFANGPGFVTFRDAVTEVNSVSSVSSDPNEFTYAGSSVPACEKKTVALKDARSVSTGGVAFSGAGLGAARWRRPAEKTAREGDTALKPDTDFATVAVWAACAVLFAFKLLINPA